MARRDDERQQRLQRMLAREQGQPLPAPPPTAETPARGAASRGGKALRRAARPDLPRRTAPAAPPSNVRPLSPILRRRRRRRRLALAAVILAVVLVAAAASGALTGAAQMLGDTVDSAVIYLNRAGGGWPADTGITAPLHSAPLAGGAVVVDGEDVAIYSAYGTLVRTIQPGYARPCLAVGSTRFALYNRSGTELRMESRTRTVYSHSFADGILLCALSANGSAAVVTQSDRYAAVLEVLDASAESVITYSLAQTDGVPVALAFAADNRRLASGAVVARGGRMQSLVYCLDTRKAELGTCYTADPGSLVLELHWLGGERILAIFDTYAAVLSADTGRELARYDYGGAVLQSAAVAGRQTALLLGGHGTATLVTLGESLAPLASVAAGDATAVAATATDVYLLTANQVLCYGYDGNARGSMAPAAPPQAVLDAAQPLVLAGGILQPLALDGKAE